MIFHHEVQQVRGFHFYRVVNWLAAKLFTIDGVALGDVLPECFGGPLAEFCPDYGINPITDRNKNV